MDIKNSLRIKYGLAPSEPTDIQVKEWGSKTKSLIAQGIDVEKAGYKAASEVFKTFRQYGYFSESDTIYDLLEELGE